MTRKPSAAPVPVPLGLPEIVSTLEGMLGPPSKPAEQLGVVRLLAVVRPDDRERWLHEVERLFPLLRTPPARLKALALGIELLAPADRPRTYADEVQAAMVELADDAEVEA